MAQLVQIRRMTREDLSFADAVRSAAGWNQTLEDWRRFLDLEPGGCFVAECQGVPAGTATTLIHGPNLAWIGMVLVQPEFRRQGIGRALLLRCIDHLREHGIRCIKLDATPLGRPVYERLGFQAEWSLSRWERPAPLPAPSSTVCGGSPRESGSEEDECGRIVDARTKPNPSAGTPAATDHPHEQSLRPFRPEDLLPGASLLGLETQAFGTPRTRLLAALARHSRASAVSEDRNGTVAGYGFLRSGAVADYLGPIVAGTGLVSESILLAMLAQSSGRRLFWDIPEPNGPAIQWATRHGFVRQRELTRMFLGENAVPGDERRQFALSGPETG